MKTTERTASPALGNAIGYFVVLWAVTNVDWITVDNQVEAVAFAGAIFTYFFLLIFFGLAALVFFGLIWMEVLIEIDRRKWMKNNYKD
jgi:hypothetical protein